MLGAGPYLDLHHRLLGIFLSSQDRQRGFAQPTVFTKAAPTASSAIARAAMFSLYVTSNHLNFTLYHKVLDECRILR